MSGPDPSRADQAATAVAIREELARRRMSRAALAAAARISLSSLEKALSGQRPFTEQTLVRLEAALDCRLRRGANGAAAVAPDDLGAYARAAVSWIEGEYLTLRPSASDPQGLYAYRTQIAWDEQSRHLVFRESDRLDSDFTQQGAVSIPHQTGCIYLITRKHGQYRLAMLTRPTITGDMHGLLMTLQTGRGAELTPAAMPLSLIPERALAQPLALGRVASGHPQHAAYSTRLRRVLDDRFAVILGGGALT